jgi:DedD protein
LKEATKQRIVGTVVLLALGLIFLPIIFDGEGSYQTPVSSRIPEPPNVPILPESEPNRPRILAESEPAANITPTTEEIAASSDEQQPDPVTDEVAAEPEEPQVEVVESQPDFDREAPRLAADGLPEGWVVRLGTFANAANARNLVTRLQDSGYKAYSRNLDNDQGSLTAVFVGPWLQRDQVEDYQRRLQDEFQLSGMIVRYEIESL